MNLTNLLAEAKKKSGCNKHPMSERDEQVFRQIIADVRLTPNQAFLIFDFMPYQHEPGVNLVNVEIFVDLYIMANFLQNAVTWGSKYPKIFADARAHNYFEAAGLHNGDWSFAADPDDRNTLYHDQLPSLGLAHQKRIKCCYPLKAGDFLRSLACENYLRLYEQQGRRKFLPDVCLFSFLPKLPKLKKLLAGRFNTETELNYLAGITSSQEAFLFYLGSLCPSFSVTPPSGLRNALVPCHYSVGDYVTLSGRIVKSAFKLCSSNAFIRGIKYDRVEVTKEQLPNGAEGELVIGIMLNGDAFIGFQEYVENGVLCQHVVVAEDFPEKQYLREYPDYEQRDDIVNNLSKINESLHKVGLPMLSDRILFKMMKNTPGNTALINDKKRIGYVAPDAPGVVRLMVHRYHNGGFFNA